MRYAREKKDKAQANNGADQYDVDTLAQQSTPDALKELEVNLSSGSLMCIPAFNASHPPPSFSPSTLLSSAQPQ